MSKYSVNNFKVDFLNKTVTLLIEGNSMQWIRIKKGELKINQSQAFNVLKPVNFKNMYDDIMNLSEMKNIESYESKKGNEIVKKKVLPTFTFSFFNTDDFRFNCGSESYVCAEEIKSLAEEIKTFKAGLKSIVDTYFN